MSWYAEDNQFGKYYCCVYRYFYYCFLFMLPLTLLFLSYHLFVENYKWNSVGAGGLVPRPWSHHIYLPMIWFLSLLFATPTAFWFTEVRPKIDDFYRNNVMQDLRANKIVHGTADSATVSMHTDDPGYELGSNMFYIMSTLITFCIPVILLFIPWCALLFQVVCGGCCARKLLPERKSDFWLSIITLFLILFFEASRTPFEFFNFHHLLTTWNVGTAKDKILPLQEFLPFGPFGESYKAVIKWAIYAPSLMHPLIYFTFSSEARHGAYVLFNRIYSCCFCKDS